MIVWTPAVLSVLYACVLYFCTCTCSALLNVLHMERRSRCMLITIIVVVVVVVVVVIITLPDAWCHRAGAWISWVCVSIL